MPSTVMLTKFKKASQPGQCSSNPWISLSSKKKRAQVMIFCLRKPKSTMNGKKRIEAKRKNPSSKQYRNPTELNWTEPNRIEPNIVDWKIETKRPKTDYFFTWRRHCRRLSVSQSFYYLKSESVASFSRVGCYFQNCNFKKWRWYVAVIRAPVDAPLRTK